MSVRIRMKKLGRTHRSFFRICAIDRHSPRDGRVLEELGTYDPSVADTDARAKLRADRIDYWLSVGAQPSDKVGVLIKKYGTNGTRLDEQKAALDKLAMPKQVPDPGKPASVPKPAEPAEAGEAPEAAKEVAPAEVASKPAEAAASEEEVKAEAPQAEAPPTEASEEKTTEEVETKTD